ncbi:hypothetical protein AWRI3580_g3236 [Hanseniaspora uvarum]|uniref:Thioredoxin-like fold domain-containing protein n=1 Tax=Hanseniaspora uvarum TaxID=29833 RepID=A0A1E5RCW9_HANUV|nr:hypothetical protein AWRI3580_g3236 [Hanseniaspora uvarum]
MSIKSAFAKSHILKPNSLIKSNPDAPINTVELYLDYACPFCLKIFSRWFEGGLFEDKFLSQHNIQIRFNNVPQPWHLRSIPIHNVGLAVARYQPESFWDYSLQLFKDAKETWDDNLNGSTPEEFNKILATHANKYTGINQDLVLAYLNDKDEGKARIPDLKYFVRYHRTVGAHVTPTVAINGIIVNNIESGTDLDTVVEIIKQQTS